jgi:hypothetical protein
LFVDSCSPDELLAEVEYERCYNDSLESTEDDDDEPSREETAAAVYSEDDSSDDPDF